MQSLAEILSEMQSEIIDLRRKVDRLERLDNPKTGILQFASPTELTIASGAITATSSYHTVDTEADGASDDLDTISGNSLGRILVLRAAHNDRTVVLKDGTDNLRLAGDCSLDNGDDVIVLLSAVSVWWEVCRSNNT